jgi:hypothetical protein
MGFAIKYSRPVVIGACYLSLERQLSNGENFE